MGQDLGHRSQGLADKSAEDQVPCPTPLTTAVQSQLWGSGHTWQGEGAAMGHSEVGRGVVGV